MASHLIYLCCGLVALNWVKAELGHDDLSEWNTQLSHVADTTAEFGRDYNSSVNFTIGMTYKFRPFILQKGSAVRVRVSAENATRDLPVLFVVKQQKSVLSWQVPLLPLKRYLYHNVSRTLCPLMDEYNRTQYLLIDVTTMSMFTMDFTLRAEIEDIMIIDGSVNVTHVSPAKPKFFFYEFPDGVDSVVVMVQSPDSLCSVLSVQDSSCPVYDLLGNVEFAGLRQTISKRGAITVEKSKYPSFFVVLVVKPNDFDCVLIENFVPPIPYNASLSEEPGMDISHRLKTFNITVEQAISKSQFIGATVGALGVFLFFYFIALVIGLIYHFRKSRTASEEGVTSETRGLLEDDLVIRNYASISPIEDTAGPSRLEAFARGSGVGSRSGGGGEGGSGSEEGSEAVRRVSSSSSSSEVSLDNEDTDLLEDANIHKEILRTKRNVCVADLARKPTKVLNKKYNLYVWNLITLAIFYALPVIQLVITYQTVVNKTGDEDLCYYNFYCARSLGVLSSFNNVFSNIGYVMLGILFVILVYRRDRLYQKQEAEPHRRLENYGIPQHFGVFYAMGIALVMEGVLSGCYHVCPSYNNFQFDTAFMYMIGWLCMLKIYQTRHPDINAHAHTAYCAIAVVVFIGVIGITTISKTYWIVFLMAYVLCSLGLTIHVYYMGRWKLDIGVFKRVYFRIRSEGLHFFKPLYIGRFILLVLGNVVNISFATYGLITMPQDFASYLLAIVIINLLMYFAFYILMKLLYREKILLQPMFYIVCATICWAFALYFFMIRLTSWQLSPAMSRESNEKCLLLHFYDRHDIWHFLSAISLFLGFMVLLTLEDDLIDVPRDKISVF